MLNQSKHRTTTIHFPDCILKVNQLSPALLLDQCRSRLCSTHRGQELPPHHCKSLFQLAACLMNGGADSHINNQSSLLEKGPELRWGMRDIIGYHHGTYPDKQTKLPFCFHFFFVLGLFCPNHYVASDVSTQLALKINGDGKQLFSRAAVPKCHIRVHISFCSYSTS